MHVVIIFFQQTKRYNFSCFHPVIVYTAEFQIFEPPRETKIGSKNRRFREIGGKIAMIYCGEGKRLLLVIWKLEKQRVREIGIPLYFNMFVFQFLTTLGKASAHCCSNPALAYLEA